MKWSYGITTVMKRKCDLLPRTLDSLRAAGFDKPRLFVDGLYDPDEYADFELPVTCRHPLVRTVANWLLSAGELYLRDPWADRYAVFQDDFICCRGLRSYLDRCGYPDKGYLNLYTFPSNQSLAPTGRIGWYESNQLGRGAVALVFNNEAMRMLLSHTHMIEKPRDAARGWRSLDGAIIESMRASGWKEYVHNPSLIQHTGLLSSMGNRQHPLAVSFPGESYNAEDFLC